MHNVTQELEAQIKYILGKSAIDLGSDGMAIKNIWLQTINNKMEMCTSCPSTVAHYKNLLQEQWNNYVASRERKERDAAYLKQQLSASTISTTEIIDAQEAVASFRKRPAKRR